MDGDLYILTLDGGEVVETSSDEIATAAAAAKVHGRSFTVTIDRPAGKRPVLTELTLAPTSTPAAAKPQAPPSSAAIAVRPVVPDGLIKSPAVLHEQLLRLRESYHVLSPAIQIAQIAEGYGANLSVVVMDPTVDMDRNGRGVDTYCNLKIMKADERALNKIALLRISQAAGVVWSPDHCRRTDDGRTRNLWRWSYYGAYRVHDGQLQPLMGSAELDLRDGSDEIKGWSDAQTKQQRSKGNEICETKAMLRAIRMLGIQQVYKAADLAKPFVMVRWSFNPDMADPEIKKLVTTQAMASLSTLFGSAAPQLPPPPLMTEALVDEDLDPAPAPATKRNPFAEATTTVPADATLIEKLEPKSGTAKSGPNKGRPWRLVTATFANGVIGSTFDAETQARLDEAKSKGWPVRVTTEPNSNPEYDDTISNLTVLDPRQPHLPGTEAL
jgi:hypothetical protein